MSIKLSFAEKYTQEHAKRYFHKHKQGFRRPLTTWRENAIARKALKLAGNPKRILDLPCGAGRFWEMLVEDPSRQLYAADNSQNMIDAAKTLSRPEVASRFECLQASAFEIPFKANFVDHILCMRLFHHISQPAHRMQLLNEFHRVAKETVCISLWVDGNLQASRLKKRVERQNPSRVVDRIVIPRAVIEDEIKQAGFEIIKYMDVLPKIAMWRFYILRKK
tara:strand:- start:141 stop:803 length:663 start_codon:yes stop_codon:yes gene_type:complete